MTARTRQRGLRCTAITRADGVLLRVTDPRVPEFWLTVELTADELQLIVAEVAGEAAEAKQAEHGRATA